MVAPSPNVRKNLNAKNLMLKKKRRVKTPRLNVFDKKWFDDEEIFQNFEEDCSNKEKPVKCLYCQDNYACVTKMGLKRHLSSDKHKDSIKSAQLRGTFIVRQKSPNELSFVKKVKECELKIASYYTEHSAALHTVDDLVLFIQDLARSAEAVAAMKMRRDKCTKLITNVLAPVEFNKCVSVLRKIPFSILIDESIGISNKKIFAVGVQYRDPVDSNVYIHLLTLLEIEAKSCSIELYAAFKDFFATHEIPLRNIISTVVADATVMNSKNISFTKYLINDVPHVIILNSICHSSNIAAQQSGQCFPKDIQDLLRTPSTHFSTNTRRSADLQRFYNIRKQKLIDERYLQNRPVLKQYLHLQLAEELVSKDKKSVFMKSKNREITLDEIDKKKDIKESRIQGADKFVNDSVIEGCLHFSSYALEYFSNFIAFFRSKGTKIHLLYDKCHRVISDISNNFVKTKSIYKCHDKNRFLSDDDYLLLDEIHLGGPCESFLKNSNLSSDIVSQIRQIAFNWYKSSLNQIKIIFLEHDDLFKLLVFLKPTVALDSSQRLSNKIPDLYDLYNYFQCDTIASTSLAFEWRSLPDIFENDREKLKVEEFWKEVSEHKSDGPGSDLMFPNLKTLIDIVLSIPHLNVDSERDFSMVNDFKNDKRANMNIDLLRALCFLKSYNRAKDRNTLNFQVTDEHLDRFTTAHMYKTYKSEDSSSHS